MSPAVKARERRVARRLDARGLDGLGEALARVSGTRVADRWVIESLYATGAEGAVFLCRDARDPSAPMRVAKIALLPYHRPFELSFQAVREGRARLREEARRLEASGSRYMPKFLGVHEFMNPLLDPARGGEFEKPEPVFVMERLPGFDLDMWLARVHGSSVPRPMVRRNVDHVTIVVLRGMWDLHERGFFYCDLRPGNVRIHGRSEHRVRLMDAGSLVARDAPNGEFPHVPAYLPPDLYLRAETEPDALVPSLAVQAVMAGRTLFEVATGRLPIPGRPVDVSLLSSETVSPAVAATIAGLCAGEFPDVHRALQFLAKATKGSRAARRSTASAVALDPAASPSAVAAGSRDLAGLLVAARSTFKPAPPLRTVRRFAAPDVEPAAAPVAERRFSEFLDRDDEILPPPRRRAWWRRFIDILLSI
jgi:serine/threonine protein kinase